MILKRAKYIDLIYKYYTQEKMSLGLKLFVFLKERVHFQNFYVLYFLNKNKSE